MKKIFLIFFIPLVSCFGEFLLTDGNKIDVVWNGVYNQSNSGQGKITVGEKSIEILNINNISNEVYTLLVVVAQKPSLRIWVYNNNQYLPIQITHKGTSNLDIEFYFNNPTNKILEFPMIFETNISMIKE